MRTIIHILMTMTFVVGLLGFNVAEASAETITVQVRSIAAAKSGSSFDPALKDLKRKLKTAFGGYSNFKQVANDSFTVEAGQKQATTLPNGSKLTVKFHGYAGKFIKLGLGIAGKLNTTLRASPGSTFFQAGLAYKGGILILAITVK